MHTIDPRVLDIRAGAVDNATFDWPVNGGAPAMAPQNFPMAQGWQHQPMPAGMPTGMPAFNAVVNVTAQNNIPMGYAGQYQPMQAGMPHNMPHNNAAPFPPAPHNVPMEHSGQYQPMRAGMNSNMPYNNAAPLPTAQHNVPMGHAGQYQPMHAGMNFNMPYNNAAPVPAAQHNVPMGHTGQHMPMHAGRPLNRPLNNAGPVFTASHNVPMGHAGLVQPMHAGMAFNMPAFNAAAAAAAPRPAAPIPAAQGAYNAPVPNGIRPAMQLGHSAAQPIVLDDAPAAQGAGTKRASPDSTAVQSAPKAKKSRFGKVEVAKLAPNTPTQAAVLPTPPNSSKRPAPVKPARREKRADPYNLMGAMYYTHVAKRANPMLDQPLDKAEEIERPMYSQQRERKPRSKPQGKIGDAAISSAVVSKKPSSAETLKPASDKQAGAAASGPVVEEEPWTPGTNPELETELQEDLVESDSEEDAEGSPVAPGATVEEDEDYSTSESDELAVDDDGNVIVDAEGMPVSASAYRAQQEAEAAMRSSDPLLVLEDPWGVHGDSSSSGEISGEEFYADSSDGEIYEEE